jgi:hypothetical protein
MPRPVEVAVPFEVLTTVSTLEVDAKATSHPAPPFHAMAGLVLEAIGSTVLAAWPVAGL